jgi:hypothetical protein
VRSRVAARPAPATPAAVCVSWFVAARAQGLVLPPRRVIRSRAPVAERARAAFSQRAKLGSPNYLKLVIDGERKLTAKMAGRFAKACGLSGTAQEYFIELVEFTHARTLEERAARYAGLKRFAQYRDARRLELAQDADHSQWYLPAIRELVQGQRFRGRSGVDRAPLDPSDQGQRSRASGRDAARARPATP